MERGKATPSIGSLIEIANALAVTMPDLSQTEFETDETFSIHTDPSSQYDIGPMTRERTLRRDHYHGVSIALVEYPPLKEVTHLPVSHGGAEYGYILTGQLVVEINGQEHHMSKGDLITFRSSHPHRIWNTGRTATRTLWYNLNRA